MIHVKSPLSHSETRSHITWHPIEFQFVFRYVR